MLGGGRGGPQQPTVIGPGDTVTITENIRLMSEASRRSELDKSDDSLRVQSRGKTGRVLKVNPKPDGESWSRRRRWGLAPRSGLGEKASREKKPTRASKATAVQFAWSGNKHYDPPGAGPRWEIICSEDTANTHTSGYSWGSDTGIVFTLNRSTSEERALYQRSWSSFALVDVCPASFFVDIITHFAFRKEKQDAD